MPRYRCYGLDLLSEFELPELPEVEGRSVDIEIRRGRLGPPPADAALLAHDLWRTDDRCGVRIPGTAGFETRDGSEIIVDVEPGADPRTVRLYLLGTILGATLMQRGHLVLHGTAFDVAGSAAVVVGHSGAGKSTLAAELQRRGHRVLSDDVVAIDASGRALPGQPRMKLWADALDRLGVPTDGLHPLHPDHAKFQVPIGMHADQALPVHWVFGLEDDQAPLQIVDLSGIEVFDLLREHTYRSELIHDRVTAAEHLHQCAQLAARASVARVRRPRDTGHVEDTAAAILARLNPLDEQRSREPA